jgi:hypothetical protein
VRATRSTTWAIGSRAIAVGVFLLGFGRPAPSLGAAPAYDDSTSSDYDDGWDAGDDGGSGFGAWVFTGGTAADFGMGSSTTNGDGDTDLDGDIDVGGSSFGITTATSGFRRAKRPFDSPFVAGEVLTIDMDTAFADNSQLSYQASIELLNATNQQRLRVGYFPGAGGWGVNDAGGFHPFVGLPASDEGLTVRIERLDDTTYLLDLIGLQQDPYETTGTFAVTGDIVAVEVTHAGVSGSTLATFWNAFEVQGAPEPGASAAVAATTALGALATRRRKRR